MKLICKIQERFRKRNKIFLALDIFLTLLTLYFAIRVLFISNQALVSAKHSTDFPNVLIFAMTLSLGLTYVVRVVEMLVTGKRKYFILHLIVAIIVLGVSAIELRWLFI
ncbi:hypothetical protein [Virgibacillus litoralis]|uniref:Membrane protein n=1 Tax=Virgibacillus litoralis TaxID=578221 RepID=A0ABS4H9G6_9BACI|nr:hypothetical protein [Virgibacillus litoralis]MBP1947544.1 putative membrane protein [Virgibacillus litoralis]